MNHHIKAAAVAALMSVSSLTFAASDMATTRQQRMDEALNSYRSGSMASSSSTSSTAATSDMPRQRGTGPAARAEESIKSGARRTGSAIKSGAEKTGHFVAEGARKTGAAIKRTGEKMGGGSTTANNKGDETHIAK